MVGLVRIPRWILLALLPALLLLVSAPSASAGRLIESGHDFDFHCRSSSTNDECHFVKVAVNYARAGAPAPTKPVLVLDRDDLDVQVAINKAFGTGAVPMTIVDPRSGAFTTTPIDTAHWSAIFVASDTTCFGCDLNDFPTGSPPAAQTQDSTAIYKRTDDIAAFFNAGGGLVVGSGADNATGTDNNPFSPTFGQPISFNSSNVPYYSFVATSGAANAAAPFTLTSLGTALGLTSSDVNCCATHNSFGSPPAGSNLKTAERDNSGRFVTLIEDTDPPAATITSGPGSTSSRSATFTFKSSEPGSFQCGLDNGGFGGCSSPKTVSGLSDGRHTFNVRAIDLVGNVQPTPTASSFCVPGGSEVPGNKVDENCDGFSAPYDKVEASLSFAFRFTSRFTTVSSLTVSKVTRGSKLKVTCKSKRKGCPFKSKTVKLKKGKARLAKLFKKHGRKTKLRKGAKIRISLTKSGLISKVFSFKVRRNKLPSLKTYCQLPGTKKLRTTCPVFVG